MAFSHGKVGFFSIADNIPTVRDLSSFLNNIDFNREADTPETTVFGLDDRTYIAGLRGGTFSISGFWDDTTTSGPDVVLDGLLGNTAASAFVYGPEGDVTGDMQYTGSAFLTSYNITGSVDGVVEFTADFIISGVVTGPTARS